MGRDENGRTDNTMVVVVMMSEYGLIDIITIIKWLIFLKYFDDKNIDFKIYHFMFLLHVVARF